MTGHRRTLLVLTTALTIVLTLGAPADAGFNAGTALSASASTATVAAPTSVTTGGTKCTTTGDIYSGYTTTLHAKVNWRSSTTTRGVTGYLLIAYFTDGTRYPVAMAPSGATSITGDYDSYFATQNIRVTVTTLTSYGWTAESDKSGVIKC